MAAAVAAVAIIVAVVVAHAAVVIAGAVAMAHAAALAAARVEGGRAAEASPSPAPPSCLSSSPPSTSGRHYPSLDGWDVSSEPSTCRIEVWRVKSATNQHQTTWQEPKPKSEQATCIENGNTNQTRNSQTKADRARTGKIRKPTTREQTRKMPKLATTSKRNRQKPETADW